MNVRGQAAGFLFVLLAFSFIARAETDRQTQEKIRATIGLLEASNKEMVNSDHQVKMGARNTRDMARQMGWACFPNSDVRFDESYQVQTNGEKTHIECNFRIRGSGVGTHVQFDIRTKGNDVEEAQVVWVQVDPQLRLRASAISDKEMKFHSNLADELGLGVVSISASFLASGELAKLLYVGQADKYQHAVAGALVGALVTEYRLLVSHDSKLKSFLYGLGAAVAVGLLKEARDKICRCGTPDLNDAAATALGGFVGSGLMSISIRF